MALTTLAVLAASALPGSPLQRLPPLAIIWLGLVLRDFSTQPERLAHAYGLQAPQPGEYPRLQARLAALAYQVGLRRPPELRLSSKPGAMFALGTFRHSYLAFSRALATTLERDLTTFTPDRRRAEAALLHELQHFSQHDVVWVELARSLLRVGVALAFWGLVLLSGMLVLALAFPIDGVLDPAFARRLDQVQPGMGQLLQALQPAGLAEAASEPRHLGLSLLFVFNAFLPLAVLLALLYATVWPRLLSVRELYADAGTAAAQNGPASLWAALSYYGSLAALRPAAKQRAAQPDRVPALGLARVLPARLPHWLWPDHPRLSTRQASLEQPEAVLERPVANGLIAGVLSAALDVLLAGVLSAQYAAVPGMLPVTLGFLAASSTLLPDAVNGGRRSVRLAGTVVALALALRLGWHALNLGLLWLGVLAAPVLTSEMLTVFVHNLAGVFRYQAEGVIGPAELAAVALRASVYWVYLGAVTAAVLAFLVAAEARLRRATLTWYSLPGGGRGLRWVLSAITASLLILALGFVLPLAGLLSPVPIGLEASLPGLALMALVLLGVLSGVGAFAWAHWRYARRCPCCQGQVAGHYELGRQCPHCSHALWPELAACY
jgi:hypothetical protein